MQIIRQLYQISLRKREPQDLEYSLEAAIVMSVGIIYLRYVSFSAMGALSSPLAYAATSILGEVAFIYALLRSQAKANRFVQTITALFGITVLVQAVSALLTLTVILQIAVPVLLLWSVYLMVIILRSALECSTIKALLLTIAYNVAGTLITVLLFPKFQTEMQEIFETMSATLDAAQAGAQ